MTGRHALIEPEAHNHTDTEHALAHVHTRHHASLAHLRLAAYAVDAMRVLRKLEQKAGSSANFSEALRAACPDWRNPGSIEEDPLDVVAEVLAQTSCELRGVFQELEGQRMATAITRSTDPR